MSMIKSRKRSNKVYKFKNSITTSPKKNDLPEIEDLTLYKKNVGPRYIDFF